MELKQIFKANKNGIRIISVSAMGVVLPIFVNGEEKHLPVELKDGDVLQVPEMNHTITKHSSSFDIEWEEK